MADHHIVIKLEGVSKKYKLFEDKKARMMEALHPLKKLYHKDFYALNNISLEVGKGEILGIVGMNGSGKSTLLKIISGIIQPSEGTLKVSGHVVPLLELGSGFNPEFTGIENVYFYNSIHGYSRKQTDAILDSILDFAEIGSFIHQPLKTYSSGMKARLAFAVSINIDPDILILDEVLSVGDELFRRKCYARMEEFFKAGKTVLFVSHSVQSINQLCSRTIFLDKGELLLEGQTKKVTMFYEKYLFSKPHLRETVRKEIINLKNTEVVKNEDFEQNIDNITVPTNPASPAKKENILSQNKPYFIPNFIPKSTVITKNSDVDIYDISIRTLDDKLVNVLVMGQVFVYSFKVKFNIDAFNVKFGMSFNTSDSFRLCGITIPSRKTPIDRILAGKEYTIEINFECNFLPGTYFTMVGVTTDINEEKNYLILIEDATVFKVQVEKESNYWGIVHFNQSAQIKIK